MPTIPAIVRPLVEMLEQPIDQIDLEKVLELVSYDKTIAGQCLRMANSPLFGRRQTETVRSAVLGVGTETGASDPARLLHEYEHSGRQVGLGSSGVLVAPLFGVVAGESAGRWRSSIGYPDPEKAYLGGLMHDLGILVNSLVCGEEFRNVSQTAAEERLALDQAEEKQLGLPTVRVERFWPNNGSPFRYR